MAIVNVPQRPSSDAAVSGPKPDRSRRRPRQNFETWQWYFMRVSGLILVFLALGHFTLTHIINDVVETDAEFVADRWDNPVWRVYDFSLLGLGLFHGLNGLRVIMDDYISSPGKRALAKSTLYTISLVLFAYGTITIVTF
jgi:succinate dehydrogenase / fumarate reductase membrane anchor subunit